MDLISKLLVKDPTQRFGYDSINIGDYKIIKEHPYFEGIDFSNISAQEAPIEMNKF